MKTSINLICIFLLSVVATELCTQKPALEDRQLVVQKEYANSIYDVDPIFDYRSIVVPGRRPFDLSGDSLARAVAYTPDISIQVQPIPYAEEMARGGHKGFVKGDIGTNNPLHAQGAYTYSAPNYYHITGLADYDHIRQDGAHEWIETLHTGLKAAYYLSRELKLDMGVAFSRDAMGLYAPATPSDQLIADSSNIFQNIGVDLGISSIKTLPSHWNYSLSSHIGEWRSTTSDTKDRSAQIRGDLRQLWSERWSWEIQADLTRSWSDTFRSRTIWGGALSLQYDHKRVYVQVGARADRLVETYMIWPEVDFRWTLDPQTKLLLSSSAKATILDAQYLSTVNAYLHERSLWAVDKNVSYERNMIARVQSSIFDESKVALTASFRQFQNGLNFILDEQDARRFTPQPVDYEQLSISFTYGQPIYYEWLDGTIELTYDKYDNATEPLLHRPTITIRPSIEASLAGDRLALSIHGWVNDPQTIQSLEGSMSSSWRYNFGASLKWAVHKRIRIYAHADNVFDDDFQVWSGYNNFGRNLSGGIMIKL